MATVRKKVTNRTANLISHLANIQAIESPAKNMST